MKTLKQIWTDKGSKGKVKINGQVWDVYDLSVNGREAILIRTVKVQGHFRRMGKYQGTGFRMISIRRPIDFVAETI